MLSLRNNDNIIPSNSNDRVDVYIFLTLITLLVEIFLLFFGLTLYITKYNIFRNYHFGTFLTKFCIVITIHVVGLIMYGLYILA